MKKILILIPVIVLIYFLGCDSDAKKYKSQFDFNVDSLIKEFTFNKYNTEDSIKLKFPIIVYREIKDDEIYQFDYSFNEELDRNLKSFSLDSIRTIVILKDSSYLIGLYTNGTGANGVLTKITYIDKKTMSKVDTRRVHGNRPPDSIYYKGSRPSSKYGTYPSNEDLIKVIKKDLNSQKK